MLKIRLRLHQRVTLKPVCFLDLKRALDPGRKDFALCARDARFALMMRAPRAKILFFTSKICFFKLNNTIFESDRLAALFHNQML